MVENNSKSKQLQWSFSYRPRKSSPDANLIEFLNSIPVKEGKEMVMQAIRGYWNVTAAMEMGNRSPEEMRLLGLTCCNMLESQSDYIRNMLLLPPRIIYLGESQNRVNHNGNSNINAGNESKRVDTATKPEAVQQVKENKNLTDIDEDLMQFNQ